MCFFKKYIKSFFMNLFKKISIIFVCLNGLLFFNIAHAKAQYSHCEASYQYAWCTLNNGIMEYRNDDKTRIDCLTKTHAVEFDFAKKWAESVGQALYYSAVTGKRAKVVLIINQPREMMYLKRVEKLAKIYDFDFEYVTNEILKLDKDGRCSYCKCKCRFYNAFP